MNSLERIEQEMLDRLVDGELDERRRDEIIRAVQNNDEWKRCALTFLESQSFAQELRRAYHDGDGADVTIARPSSARQPPRRTELPPNLGWWLTTAACVVFAFTMGTRLPPAPAVPATSSSTIAESSPDLGQHQLAGHRPADIWKGESMVPLDIETTLNQLGHRVDRQKGFMPALSAEGNRVLVPYEDVQIQPARHAPQ